MSFWDNVKKFAQPYSDDDYEEYDEEEEVEDLAEEEEEEVAPRPARRTSLFGSSKSSAADLNPTPAAPASSSFSGQVVSMGSGKQEVVLFHAKAFDDAAKAADELRSKKAIILNMENIDKALTRRVVDFLSGTIYALDGKVKKVAQATYLFCPHSMDIVGELDSFQAEAESYV